MFLLKSGVVWGVRGVHYPQPYKNKNKNILYIEEYKKAP
jgi:hypothetical protein